MTRGQLVRRSGPVGVEPHRPASMVVGFPAVAGVNVAVQLVVAVAEHFVVDALEGRVELDAGRLHGFPEQRQVVQERGPCLAGQLGELVDPRVLLEQDAVAGQVLGVADHRPAGPQARQHGGVVAALRRADPVVSPICARCQPPTVLPGAR